ncbi:MAG: hypothetical protein R3F29_06095 [Planctomycetota bacterium]
MSALRHPWFVAANLLAALCVAPVLSAQSDTAAIAEAMVAARAPASDDPDSMAAALIEAAKAHPRSPVAWLLIEELTDRITEVQDVERLRALLPSSDDRQMHGLLAQKLAELDWYFRRWSDGEVEAGSPPGCGYAREGLAVGPFGDDGDHYVGVVLAPELSFPALGERLDGRYAPVTAHVLRAHWQSAFLEPSRDSGKHGAWFVRLRCAADEDVDGFFELDHEGAAQVFVDGREVLRVERYRRTGLRRQYVGLHLPRGAHEVVVKTCAENVDKFAARWLSADGWPMAAVRWLSHDDATPAAEAEASPSQAQFVVAGEVLAKAAERDDAAPVVQVAALLAAVRDGHQDLAIDLSHRLRAAPPQQPVVQLTLAQLLNDVGLPDELVKAEARRLVDAAVAALPEQHLSAVMARVRLLDQQDQREQALKLLAPMPAGPVTFARRVEMARKLRFEAEVEPLLQQWAAAMPADIRPRWQLANLRQRASDGRGELQLWREIVGLRRGAGGAYQQAVRCAIENGEHAQALEWLEQMFGPVEGHDACVRLNWRIYLARARGDEAAIDALLGELGAHPDADAAQLVAVAGDLVERGRVDEAARCIERALTLDPDRVDLREWLAQLGKAPGDDAEFAPFRRDGAAIAKAFVAGEREQRASTTVVLDHRIMIVHPDGSVSTEVHELRRINDQAGVEQFGSPQGLGRLEDVRLVRTIGADGEFYVPSRIDREYSMQRLQPGAFVEWQFRTHSAAPGPSAFSTGAFYFGSGSEPCAMSELVLVLPRSVRGALRARLIGAPQRDEVLDDGRRVLVYRLEDLGDLPEEAFLPSLIEILPTVEYGEDDVPYATLRGHEVGLLQRTHPTAPIREQAAALFAGVDDPRQRAEAAWRFCQEQIENGDSQNALDALVRKKGDRYLLAVALMRAGGLDVAALGCEAVREDLTEGRSALFLGTDAVDMPAAAVLVDGGPIAMFPDTPRFWPLGRVPAHRAGTTAWLVDGDRLSTFQLPGTDSATRALTVRGRAVVEGKNLVLTVTAEIGDISGYHLAQQVRDLKENVKKLAARQIAQQVFEGFQVKSAKLLEGDGPTRVEAVLQRAAVQPAGDGFLAQLPMAQNKLVQSYGDRAERVYPCRFTVDQLDDWEIEFDPGELQIARLPAPVAIRGGGMQFELRCRRAEHGIVISRQLRMSPTTIAAADFVPWLDALDAADRAEQATIELRR